MLEWGMKQQDHPVAIRVPAMGVIASGSEDTTDYSKLNKYEVTKAGKDVAVIALGDFYQLGESVVTKLSKENNIDATLINPKYITGIDEELLESLKKEHKLVITLEDGILDGGFGEKITRYYGPSDMKVINYGIKKELLDRYVPEELMKKNRLTDVQIIEDIISIIK
jgi:1-deoxy-D-xylulose-5-phosphate synthase